jgi:ElaB/YqjD/DUF883 family membrane-anchored ribosome-binding protein
MATAPTETASSEQGAGGMTQELVSRTQERAEGLKGQASKQVRSQVETRSTQAGEQLSAIAQALRKGGEQLHGEGNDTGASAAHAAAEHTERLAGYLSGSSADKLLGDLEGVARAKPWLAGAVGAAIGLMAARFLKASSERRYQATRPAVPVGEPRVGTTPAPWGGPVGEGS